jgi:hypothetical protein
MLRLRNTALFNLELIGKLLGSNSSDYSGLCESLSGDHEEGTGCPKRQSYLIFSSIFRFLAPKLLSNIASDQTLIVVGWTRSTQGI